MRLRPESGDLDNVAQPSNPGFLVPRSRFGFAHRSRVGGIRRSGNKKRYARDAPAQQAMCGDERPHSLIVEEPPDKSECRRTDRFGDRRQTINVDARTWNQRNAILGYAERY